MSVRHIRRDAPFSFGGMAERLNAAVSKTAGVQASQGPNPCASARLASLESLELRVESGDINSDK